MRVIIIYKLHDLLYLLFLLFLNKLINTLTYQLINTHQCKSVTCKFDHNENYIFYSTYKYRGY